MRNRLQLGFHLSVQQKAKQSQLPHLPFGAEEALEILTTSGLSVSVSLWYMESGSHEH